MPSLILIGGGHAHLSVLRELIRVRLDIDAVLITPSPYQTYSGMLPGWMAGHYRLSDCQIDLRPIAQAAGVKLILAQVLGMDADRCRVALSDGSYLGYDFASLDIGSETNLSWLQALGERLLPIKPLGEFVQRWPDILKQAEQQNKFHLAVVGGGAAGVELAFTAQYALAMRASKARVSLIASEKGILPGHSPSVIKRAAEVLKQRGIELHQAHAVGDENGLLLANGQLLNADIVIATTGATPPTWLQFSKLALDEHGYISVESTHLSSSHPNVFAAGDVCARSDVAMARSGVHAVFSGPVVAHNLMACISGGKFISYSPRRRSLYLLATGSKHAIVSWGAFCASGNWVWRWKNWIDQRFMTKHRVKEGA